MGDMSILTLTRDLTSELMTLFLRSGACCGGWGTLRVRPKVRQASTPDVWHERYAGILRARACGARVPKASPMDRAEQSKSVGLFVGSISVFRKTGCIEATRDRAGRPLLRLIL